MIAVSPLELVTKIAAWTSLTDILVQQYPRRPEGSSDSGTRDNSNRSNLVVEAVNFTIRH